METVSDDKLPASSWNERLIDVPKAFNTVVDDGQFRYYEGAVNDVEGFASHVQGMASYRSQYYIFTHSNYLGSHGRILVIDRLKGSMVMEFPNTGDGLNHPGGCQVIGDYLAVALENGDNQNGVVHFYDLSMMDDHTRPALLPVVVPARGGAGAVAITDIGEGYNRQYLLAIYDDHAVTFYKSEYCSLTDPNCHFAYAYDQRKLGPNGADNICLITDVNNNVFLLALSGVENFGVYIEDWADLYSVSLSDGSLRLLHSRHLHTQGGKYGLPGIHFRWGAGLQILNNTEIGPYCSARNFMEQHGFDNGIRINFFRPPQMLTQISEPARP